MTILDDYKKRKINSIEKARSNDLKNKNINNRISNKSISKDNDTDCYEKFYVNNFKKGECENEK